MIKRVKQADSLPNNREINYLFVFINDFYHNTFLIRGFFVLVYVGLG